jgi:hypothetical protein
METQQTSLNFLSLCDGLKEVVTTRRTEETSLKFKSLLQNFKALGFGISKEFIYRCFENLNRAEYKRLNVRLNRILKESELKTEVVKRYYVELRSIKGNLYRCKTSEQIHLILIK